MSEATGTIHPAWLRATHWINALAVLIMIMSGWRIYNASPLFDFKFAKDITLGGWLGGAILWHFAAMWLLAANGLIYLLCNVASGRLVRKFFPLSPRAIGANLLAALRGRLAHSDLRQYNAAQRAAYLFAIADRCCWFCPAWCCGNRCSFLCCANCWAATRARAACTFSPWRRWSPSSRCTWRWWRWCRAHYWP